MTEDGRNPPQNGLQTLATGIMILETLSRRDEGIGVSQLAREIGMPKAKVHRYLTTLRDLGYLEQDPANDSYRAGWGLYLLAHDTQAHFSLTRRARPIMTRLSEAVQLTVVLSTFTSEDFVVLDFVVPPAPLEMGLRAGSRFPLNSGAQGKVGLAFGPAEWRKGFLDRDLPAVTKATITDPATLSAELDDVRTQGWAAAPSQLFVGINAVAVPVFGHDEMLAGALAVVGLNSALPSKPGEKLVSALKGAANELSRSLGFGLTLPKRT